MAALAAIATLGLKPTSANTQKTATPDEAKPEAQIPAQFQRIDTKYRFESNGDSRKEVHAVVKINSELGVRQFARLKFGYNRAFQSVEIPLVRITHPSGGTADILPSAIADNPDPAVLDFSAYRDVRLKSVRILGLAPGDALEYRVVTKTTRPPLAPDFWLAHSFERSGVVREEDFELDLPAEVAVEINPKTPADSIKESGTGSSARRIYHWRRKQEVADSSEKTGEPEKPDIALSTLDKDSSLSARLADLVYPTGSASRALREKAEELTESAKDETEKLHAIYDFVATKILTVDLPAGSTGFHTRMPEEIVAAGYAIPEDKARLFAALARAAHLSPSIYFSFSGEKDSIVSLPSRFEHLLVSATVAAREVWLDPVVEVAPFGMISAKYRGKPVFRISAAAVGAGNDARCMPTVPDKLPFPAMQRVDVSATLSSNGSLAAKVKYTLRGDNELLLRIAFHQDSKDRWNELAQLLALSDGFRGQIKAVEASDPLSTAKPFEVGYEIAQPRFVDWTKKPVRIPAILPLVSLPDPPEEGGSIELGTPLDVDLSVTLQLPQGATARVPAAISVERDYASYKSKYSMEAGAIVADRHLRFLRRGLPAERFSDYNAFLHAVQNDEGQDFTLERTKDTAER